AHQARGEIASSGRTLDNDVRRSGPQGLRVVARMSAHHQRVYAQDGGAISGATGPRMSPSRVKNAIWLIRRSPPAASSRRSGEGGCGLRGPPPHRIYEFREDVT